MKHPNRTTEKLAARVDAATIATVEALAASTGETKRIVVEALIAVGSANPGALVAEIARRKTLAVETCLRHADNPRRRS